MDSTKLSAILLILTIFISTTPAPILSCSFCPPTTKPYPPTTRPPKSNPPKTKRPIVLPPTIGKPPITVIGNPPSTGNTPCPPGSTPTTPAGPATCPIDTLKLGACVDLLQGLVHIVVGDPVVNQCCPVLEGLVAVEAAVCLCTTIRLRLLNINVYLPIALQLLITCGKTPPPGYTCTI